MPDVNDSVVASAVAQIQGAQQRNNANPSTGASTNAADVLANISRMSPTIPLTQGPVGPSNPGYLAKQQAQFAPTEDRTFRTSSENKRVTMSNLAGDIGNMVNTARKNSEAQKARTLSVDIERIYQSQEGIMQAKEILENPSSSPQDKQKAQSQLQQDQQIINDLLADPKKRKEIEKAFDVKLVGEDKNAGTWQRKAGDIAAKNYAKTQKSDSYYDQLEKQLPQIMKQSQMSQQAQQQMLQSMKAMAPYFKAMQEAKTQQDKMELTRQNKELDVLVKDADRLSREKIATDKLDVEKDKNKISAYKAAKYGELADAKVAELKNKVGVDGLKKEIAGLDGLKKAYESKIHAADSTIAKYATVSPSDLAKVPDAEAAYKEALASKRLYAEKLGHLIPYYESATKAVRDSISKGAEQNGTSQSTSSNGSSTGTSGQPSTSSGNTTVTPKEPTPDDIIKDDFGNEDEEDN